MRVLMPETRSDAALNAKRVLSRAGHAVETCAPDAKSRCVALRGGRCPLEVSPVDMVVLVRAVASPDRLPGEEGVLCGARRRIPVVVAGAGAAHPYADIATVDDETDDVLTTVEMVGGLPLADHTVAASAALHTCLAQRGVALRGRARVYRRDGRLAAELHFDGDIRDRGVVTAVAVRVVAALRAIDPWASGVDVSVV